MFSRREALRQLSLGAGGLALAPFLRQLEAEAAGDPELLPKRFVFVVRSNGLLTTELQPRGLEDLVTTRPHASEIREARDIALASHKLHPAMAALEPLKDRVTLFQGLSGKMCRGDHEAGFGALALTPERV